MAPIFQTTTFTHDPSVDGENGYFSTRYTRCNNNPSQGYISAKLAAMEGAEAGLVLSSGMAAISCTLLALLKVRPLFWGSRGSRGAWESSTQRRHETVTPPPARTLAHVVQSGDHMLMPAGPYGTRGCWVRMNCLGGLHAPWLHAHHPSLICAGGTHGFVTMDLPGAASYACRCCCTTAGFPCRGAARSTHPCFTAACPPTPTRLGHHPHHL